MRRSALSLALAAIVVFSSSAAGAQPAAAAEVLFAEGKHLMEQGRILEGCAKLEESVRLDPAGGAQMNLALCWEKGGRLASAWSAFRSARERAARDHRPDRVQEADRKLAELEPRLGRLRIVMSPGPSGSPSSPGVEVLLDGVALGPASLSTLVPLDAVTHRIEARAQGHRSWIKEIVVRDGVEQTVEVPRLVRVTEDRATEPGASLAPRRPDPPVSPWTTRVLVAGGLGIVGLGVGTIFGLRAADRHDASGCSSSGCPDAAGAALEDDARSAAWVSNIGLVAGVIGLAAAVYFFVRDSEAPRGVMR